MDAVNDMRFGKVAASEINMIIRYQAGAWFRSANDPNGHVNADGIVVYDVLIGKGLFPSRHLVGIQGVLASATRLTAPSPPVEGSG
jgi:hypothetical protein